MINPDYQYRFKKWNGQTRVHEVSEFTEWLIKKRGYKGHIGWFQEIGMWIHPPTQQERDEYDSLKN